MTQNNEHKRPKIAVTGGYASGKSTVMKRFRERGFVTVSADEVYSELLENESFVREVSRLAGVEPQTKNGSVTLDRAGVSKSIFSDEKRLKAVNEFTHAAVYRRMDEIFQSKKDKFFVFEIPLLFESGRQNDYDLVIVVERGVADRIRFGTRRDGISVPEAESRIRNQFDYNNIDCKAHTVLYNDSTVEELYGKVDMLIEKIKKDLY